MSDAPQILPQSMRAIRWRIYRLPGDREYWRIDHGPGSILLWARQLHISTPMSTIDDRSGAQPRAWISTKGVLYLSDDGICKIVPEEKA